MLQYFYLKILVASMQSDGVFVSLLAEEKV